jgi:hypothetical protein
MGKACNWPVGGNYNTFHFNSNAIIMLPHTINGCISALSTYQEMETATPAHNPSHVQCPPLTTTIIIGR